MLLGKVALLIRQIAPNTSPYSSVRSLARDLYGRLWHKKRPPYHATDYANILHVHVEYRPITAEGFLTTVAGLEEMDKNAGWNRSFESRESPSAPVIVLRELRSDERERLRCRQQFTLAHELGHYVIRKEILRHFPSASFSPDDPGEEKLCNLFAAQILMPPAPFGKYLCRKELSPDRLLELQKIFDVSLQSVSITAASLIRIRKTVIVALYRKPGNRPILEFMTPKRLRPAFDTLIDEISYAFQSEGGICGEHELFVDGSWSTWRSCSKRIHNAERVLTLLERTTPEIKASSKSDTSGVSPSWRVPCGTCEQQEMRWQQGASTCSI
jgi:hypothetical protein